MPHYMVAFHGGEPPQADEAMADFMTRWKRWSEGIGDAIAHEGAVFSKAIRMIDADGGTADPGPERLTGYYLLRADDLMDACARLRGCPIFQVGGTIEVAELMLATMTTGSGEDACA